MDLRRGSFSPHPLDCETPEPIGLQFGIFDYVRRPTHVQNMVAAANGGWGGHMGEVVPTSDILVQKIILVLVHCQTAVSHRISSVLRECSYINSATLTPSLRETVTVGKTFIPALSEFYANAPVETPEQ